MEVTHNKGKPFKPVTKAETEAAVALLEKAQEEKEYQAELKRQMREEKERQDELDRRQREAEESC